MNDEEIIHIRGKQRPDPGSLVESMRGSKGKGRLYCWVSLSALAPDLVDGANDTSSNTAEYAVVICGRRHMTFTRLLTATKGSCWMTWPMVQLPDEPGSGDQIFRRSTLADPPPRSSRSKNVSDSRPVLYTALQPKGASVLKVHLKTRMMSADPVDVRRNGSLCILLGLVKLYGMKNGKVEEEQMRSNPRLAQCFQESDIFRERATQADKASSTESAIGT